MSQDQMFEQLFEAAMDRNQLHHANGLSIDYIARFPDDPRGYSLRASILRNLGRKELVVPFMTSAILRAPDQAGYYAKRGDAYFEQKQYAEAIADYLSFLRTDDGRDPTAVKYIHLPLAESYFRIGDLDQAEAICALIPDDFVMPGFRGLMNGSKHFILADIAARRRAGR